MGWRCSLSLSGLVSTVHAQQELVKNILGKELVIDVLHDEIGEKQALFCRVGLTVHGKDALSVFVKTAEAACETGFSGAVMTDDADDCALWKRKRWDVNDIWPAFLISKGEILQVQRGVVV